MFEKDLALNVLLDTYGNLLPDSQRDVFEQYYCDDLSLAEIAENTGITRQGVRDRIAKARNALLHYEDMLGFVAKLKILKESASEIDNALSALGKNSAENTAQIENIRRILAGMPF